MPGSITPLRTGRRRARHPITVVAALAAATLASVALVGPAHATRSESASGFTSPFAGTPRYTRYAPTELVSPRQLEQPLGRRAADRLAVELGLDPTAVFTPAQYALFVSGKGRGGDPSQARLVDESVRILTNTAGRPIYAHVDGRVVPTVLASYGLFVSTDGWLESPANAASPARLVNAVIAPGGYLGQWCRANGASRSLRALYRSAYPLETLYGFVAQQQSDAAQLAPNRKRSASVEVGMSMAPALWIVNFLLIYTLNPDLAAAMPAHWAPVPATVASAMESSSDGRVPYADYARLLP